MRDGVSKKIFFTDIVGTLLYVLKVMRCCILAAVVRALEEGL